MAWQTDRILVYDRSLSFLFELAPDEITKRVRTEELNGTHELELVTSRVLHEGYRLLTVDNTGKWREHVVYKPDEDHAKGRHATGTYVCVWSLQYDLTVTVEGGVAQPGMGSSCTAANAVRAALGGQTTWEVGSCDVGPVAAGKGCVMVYNNAWDRLKQVASAWGGEVDAEIEVDASKVVTRNVVLRAHLGSTKVTRRFDWGEDLTRIKRTPDPGPYYCRVVPLGKGQREYAEDDETEFDWPLDISEETPDGRIYIQDDDAAAVFRIADGNGGWRYPTKIVRYDEDDPELLLNDALADLPNHTRPGAGYEADVLQFAEAGMDVQGVELGDDTQCVDYGFNPDAALRVQGRVTRMVVNELAPKIDTKLTIGSLGTSLATALKGLIGNSTQDLTNRVNHIEGDVDSITSGGTIAYVEGLLDAINAMIAADGGYTYLVPGEGSITYDKAVADPLVGTEATRVTQMKGGSLRFAKAKKPGFSGINDWDWTNVVTPNGYLGLAATIAAITTGFIGNANQGSYWDLDNGILHISIDDSIGGRTVDSILGELDGAGIDKIEYGTSASSTTAPTTWSTTAPTSVAKGSWLWIRTTYKNGTTSTTKAYAGTDGQNGADGADGSDGQDGSDGIGITSVTPQYYLSTSSSSATGGSWSSSPPAWSANHYIWTRSLITWDTTPSTTSTTTAVYDAALTQANQNAAQAIADAAAAAKVATNYLTFDASTGLDIGYSGTNAKTRVNASGMEVFDGNGDSALFAGLDNGSSIVRVGKASGSGNVVMSSEGYVDVRNGSDVMAHFGYAEGKDYYDKLSVAPYYNIGIRNASGAIGNYSVAEGYDTIAAGFASHAEGGMDNAIRTLAGGKFSHAEGAGAVASADFSHSEGCRSTASGFSSHAEGYITIAYGINSHAEGSGTLAQGADSHAEGKDTTAYGDYSHAEGEGTYASGRYQHVCGTYNVTSSSHLLIVGKGGLGARSNAFYVSSTGNLWCAGTLTQGSDRRLKEHHAYLGEDAADFIRALKPALYTKDGTRHVGFYAQDVQDAEPEEWDTVTVTPQHTDESLDFDPLTLDYTALIAPLVAYTQGLEKQINALTARLDVLEGKR